MKRQGFIKGSAILLAMVLITKILGLLYKIPLTNLLGGTGMDISLQHSQFSHQFSPSSFQVSPPPWLALPLKTMPLNAFQICVIPSELHFFFSRSSAQPLLQ